MPKPLPDDVRNALSAGRKIDAIRLLREQTGLGLAEAKDAVEAGAVPDASPVPSEFADLPPDVAAALATGRTVKAIKLLREARGIGLRDAKTIIDQASREVRQREKRQSGGVSPVEAPRNGLSPVTVVLLAVIIVAIAWLYANSQ